MAFFVSESLKGLLTEEELIDTKSRKGVFDALTVVIGNEEQEH